MSDRTLEPGSLEWGVDWASAKTWGKFVGISMLIALAFVVANITVVGAARLAASFTHGNLAGEYLRPLSSEVDLPWPHRVVAFITMWLALVTPLNLWAAKLPARTVSDDFPIGLLEDERKGYFGWMVFILTLFGLMLIPLFGVPAGMFSVSDDNISIFSLFPLFALIFGKDDIKVLFWKILAENRSPDSWAMARQSWSDRGPGFVIALLAVIGFLAFGLLAMIVKTWVWH